MGMIRKVIQAEVLKQFDDGSQEIVISTDAVDRAGDVIEQDGWEVENYLANPVVLFAHDYRSVPIGKTLELRREPHTLIARFKFREPANDADPVAFVRSAWDQKMLNAASVGFDPIDFEPMPESETDDRFYLPPTHWIANELLEFSIVTIPMNQEALRRSLEEYLMMLGADLPHPVSAPRGGSSDPANPSHHEALTALSSFLDALKGHYVR